MLNSFLRALRRPRRPGRAPAVVAALVLAVPLAVATAGAAPEPADSSPRLLLVHHTERGLQALASSSARTVARYEAYTLVEAAGEDAERLRDAGAEPREDMRSVRLRGRDVDPAAARAPLPQRARSGAAGPALVLVQFVGPPKDAWLERVRETGVRVVTYMAQNGYAVHGSAREIAALARLADGDPAVRALTELEPGDKLAPGLAARGASAFAIQTLSGDDGDAARAAVRARGRSLRPESRVGAFATQYVAGDAAALRALAADPAVLSIEPYVPPQLRDERAAQIVAGNLTAAHAPTAPGYLAWLASRGFGASTFDFAVDVTDEGLDDPTTASLHPDFHENGGAAAPTRVNYKRNWTDDVDARDCGGHGTNVASIAAGYNDVSGDPDLEDAEGFNYGLGIAPRARIGASKIFQCDNSFELNGTFSDLASNAYANGARVSNNSWGAAVFGDYNADSQEYDSLVRDAQPGVAGAQALVEVFANGNDGPGAGSVGSPATAKNVISVGASENVRAIGFSDGCGVSDSEANSARDIIDFSSRGPTDDGRTKPDVVAPGTHVTGAQPQVGLSYDGDGTCTPQFPAGSTLYSLVSGTSQATPEVSGFAALIRDHYRRTVGGGTATPSPAMTKAIMVNTAVDLAGGVDGGLGGQVDPIPDQSQGWGRISAGNAFDSTQRHHVDQTIVLGASGEQHSLRFEAVDASRPVRVSLAWSDPPGPTAGNAFVNDLDLRVTRGTTTFRGNVMANGTSTSGGVADTRNNLENVFLPAGTTGRMTVTVAATTIAGNGVPGNADATDQDFALVVSNARLTPNQAPTASFTAAPNPVTAGESVALDASASRDADGSVSSYAWDLDGDGSFETAGGASPTLTRAFSTPGDVRVGLRVTDDEGATGTSTQTLTVQQGQSPPPPPPPPDRTAPRISVSVLSSGRIRDLLARRMRVEVVCDEPCSIVADVSIRVPTRTRRTRSVVVARATARRSSAGTARMRVAPTRTGRRILLRTTRSTLATLRVRATDRESNRRTVTRRFRLRR